ncbi:26S proteasome non-ATPase regulatory subunit 9-like protein [Chytriomyces cf. hyalinus JEL632]|nr:26S proteasome non-ATPase regulatory subunit 9-like protein [Chytriomyces cf. hyalinus JEL632]
MMSGNSDPRARYTHLQEKKTALESELLELLDSLKTHNTNMTDPLVDTQNFPRSDIDVYTVRHLRSSIIRKQNDHKALMAQIEQEMHCVFSSMASKPSAPVPSNSTSTILDSTTRAPSTPFALVNSVADGSPAAESGLSPGDRVIRFGSVEAAARGGETNQQVLAKLASVVVEGRAVEVVVLRGMETCVLSLTPQKWSGRGLLGCHLLSVV